MKKLMYIIFVVFLAFIVLSGYKNNQSKALGVRNDVQLHHCPSSPNCISSNVLEDKTHYYKAFDMNIISFKKLLTQLENMKDIEIIKVDGHYIHAVASTKLGFKDDLEFLFIEGNKKCYIRSLSRLGYYDLGKNRNRMNTIKDSL